MAEGKPKFSQITGDEKRKTVSKCNNKRIQTYSLPQIYMHLINTHEYCMVKMFLTEEN